MRTCGDAWQCARRAPPCLPRAPQWVECDCPWEGGVAAAGSAPRKDQVVGYGRTVRVVAPHWTVVVEEHRALQELVEDADIGTDIDWVSEATAAETWEKEKQVDSMDCASEEATKLALGLCRA